MHYFSFVMEELVDLLQISQKWPNQNFNFITSWRFEITPPVRLLQSLNFVSKYSRTSLSRTHLFRITPYLEVKIWSLF